MKTVAMDETTYGRLFAYRAALEIKSRQCPHLYPVWMGTGRVSLDDAISFLLDQQERHGERAKKYRKRVAGKTGAGDPPADEVWDDDDIVGIPAEHLPPPGGAA